MYLVTYHHWRCLEFCFGVGVNLNKGDDETFHAPKFRDMFTIAGLFSYVTSPVGYI